MTADLPITSHMTSRDLAYALSDYACAASGKRVSLLPFNRYQPDNTFWWICPGADDPAYHYGKFVTKSAEQSGDLFAGICFEKGIGASLAGMYKKSRVWTSWIWNPFLASLKEGRFASLLNDVERSAHRPVDVIVTVGTRNFPDTGERGEEAFKTTDKQPRQTVHYTFSDSRLSLLHDHSEEKIWISAASECRTLTDLSAKIQTIEGLDWVWINVDFGFVLSHGMGDGPIWNTELIWSNACEPFIEWFR